MIGRLSFRFSTLNHAQAEAQGAQAQAQEAQVQEDNVVGFLLHLLHFGIILKIDCPVN